MNAKVNASQEQQRNFHTFFFLRFYFAQKVYTSCTRTGHKIVPLTNMNKYLHYDRSETGVNINVSVNNGSKKL